MEVRPAAIAREHVVRLLHEMDDDCDEFIHDVLHNCPGCVGAA